MKSTKCTSCGANINIDNSVKNFRCPYCGTNFINENYEKEEIVNVVIDKNVENEEKINENDYPNYVHGSRPTFSFILFLILLCFYVWPGIIYAIGVARKQYVWDKYHSSKK